MGKVAKGAKRVDGEWEKDDTSLKEGCKVLFLVDMDFSVKLGPDAREVSPLDKFVLVGGLSLTGIRTISHSYINGKEGSWEWRGDTQSRRLKVESDICWPLVRKAKVGKKATSLAGDRVFAGDKLGKRCKGGGDEIKHIADVITETFLAVSAFE